MYNFTIHLNRYNTIGGRVLGIQSVGKGKEE
jgi:hypothetical protein